MQGAHGTGAQTGQMGVVPLTEPMEEGDACFRSQDVIGENGGLRAEGMAGGRQEAFAGSE